MKNFPALDFPLSTDADPDRILAAADDFSPTAVEERETGLRIFFDSPEVRRAALAALTQNGFAPLSVDVSDEDWARRSQEALGPVTVGRVTVTPPWSPQPPVTSHQPPVTIVIAPSMGFGTGHHATTRLCLAALQTLDLSNRSVLDVGTGSGVLAIAAARLGATHALGIDNDPDAITAATENLARNPQADGVTFRVADFTASPLLPADVVTANLTGTLLVRAARRLAALVSPGGTLIVSGLLAKEEPTVCAAFPSDVAWHAGEDGWVCVAFRMPH